MFLRESSPPEEACMLISDLLKGQRTVAADSSQTVMQIAGIMVEHNIGAVHVLDQSQLVGIFSERDLMSRVVAAGKNPAVTIVREVMTEDPLTVEPKESLEVFMTLMRRHGFRHLLVCEGRELRGVISLRDILLHDLNEKDDEV